MSWKEAAISRYCSPGGGLEGICCTYLIVGDPTAMSHPPTSSMSSWLSLHYGPDQLLEVGYRQLTALSLYLSLVVRRLALTSPGRQENTRRQEI